MIESFRAIDSHTGGEPTRVVLAESLGLQGDSLAQMGADFSTRFDHYRAGFVCEPRGSDIVVGALLVPGVRAEFGVIFFNNIGLLGMCGHGTIGLARTLLHLGHWKPGFQQIDTPVGVVDLEVAADGTTTFQNVECFLVQEGLEVSAQGRTYRGDIAWGGNAFFLCDNHGLDITVKNVPALMATADAIQETLNNYGEVEGRPVDHIELIGSGTEGAHARNFVRCPGGAYDRSPCGTGTSAKVATLASKGQLAPGEVWRQQSVTGSIFEAWYTEEGPVIRPFIRATAYLTAESDLLFEPNDPLRHGFTPEATGG